MDTKSSGIEVKQFPQLRSLCWNRPGDTILDGETALAVYERNWRFVDYDALTSDELAMLNHLIAVHGCGYLMAGSS